MPKTLLWILGLSFLIRALLAYGMELGVDEVYYWTYAKYPALSHFDHPPMLGWFIQLFSLNLLLDSAFFIRLASLVCGSINTYLMYRIGLLIWDNKKAAIYGALIYNLSVYGLIITGVFILPDTPMTLFWNLAILQGVYFIQKREENYKYLYGFAVFTGLAMLSKHQSAALWGGIVLYLIFFNKSVFKKIHFYLSFTLSFLFLIPVAIWNYNNDMASFKFQGERINVFEGGIRLDYFFSEILGQMLYQNPLVFIGIIMGLVWLIKNGLWKRERYFLLFCGLIPIGIFISFSLFRSTLPHWAAPGYLCLIPLTSIFFTKIPKLTYSAALLISVSIVMGYAQIQYGFWIDKNDAVDKQGSNDFSLDVYGWRQLNKNLALSEQHFEDSTGFKPKGYLSEKWFPAAHIDYYIAKKQGLPVYVKGPLENNHKYAWINTHNPKLQIGDDLYFITSSRYFRSPEDYFGSCFEAIHPIDTLAIKKGEKVAGYFFLYSLENMSVSPEEIFSSKKP